jgi:4-carboxymuconolactone decarboxylase
MSRVPYLGYEEIGDEGRAVWDEVIKTRGGSDFVDVEGSSVAVQAWVNAPSVGGPALALGAAVKYATSIDRDLTELAIITVGARWKAEFEFWAHSRVALAHGVEQAVIEAIAVGREPELTTDRQRIVYRVAKQIADQGTVEPETLDTAVAELGLNAMVELTTLCGYYTMVAFVLNAFVVPLPNGVAPRWT